ncbi:hypothetical protein AgCh_018758 [Apium graveolens]
MQIGFKLDGSKILISESANNFSIGMVMRNYACDFMAARNCKISGEVSVFEAESVGVCEALSWIKEMQRQEDEIIIESDSQLSVNAIRATRINYLEVGEFKPFNKRCLAKNMVTSLVSDEVDPEDVTSYIN